MHFKTIFNRFDLLLNLKLIKIIFMKRISILSTALFVSLLMFNCNNSAGINLIEGEDYEKSYSIGDNAMTNRLQKLSEAYSNKDSETLLQYYDEDFLGENGAEGIKLVRVHGFNKHESLCYNTYKITR